jgi:hypothetical protein
MLLMSQVLAAMVLLAGDAPQDLDRKANELRWAKGVAEDFLAAALAGDDKAAASLIDATLKAAHAKDGETAFASWINNALAIQRYSNAAIKTETIAPDSDEAVFRGSMLRLEPNQIYDFSIRVVKEKESGKWRVSMFRWSRAETPK